jgi:transcriptional regulator GlxA family with amidase domain
MHTVAVAVVSGTAPFELATAVEVFGSDRSYLTPDWYSFKLCAAEPGPLHVQGGLLVETPYGIDDLVTADTVIVPAAGEQPEEHGPLLEALRTAYKRGARIASICTGAYILAEAGLLDGRRATTHWAWAGDFAERYPAVDVDPNVLYVEDGRLFTSAGTAAGIDLCLHLVRQDLGTDIANAVARRMVVPPHRDGGQAQFVDAPLMTLPDDPVKTLLEWMRENLDKPLSVPDLAARLHVSPRTLTRRFSAATGLTPHQWLIRERLLLVQSLLERTDESVDRIARRCGFPSAATMRHLFRRELGSTPQTYRSAFRARQAAEAEAC